MLNKSWKYSCLLLAQIMSGVNIIGCKYLVSAMPMFLLLSFRFLSASLFLFALYWISNKYNVFFVSAFKRIKILLFYRKNGAYFNINKSKKNQAALIEHYQYKLRNLTKLTAHEWVLIFLSAISAGIGFNIFMLWGLHYTDANIAGIITSCLPAMIVFLSWLILHEKFTYKKVLCIAFATCGLVVINLQNGTSTSSNSLLGVALIFLALVPEALYYIISKFRTITLPVFLMAGLLNSINAILLSPYLFMHSLKWQLLSLPQWIAFTAVCMSSAFFYVFWYLGSKDTDTGLASLSTAFMPISTLVIAWLILKEKIHLIQFIGMGLIILSIFIYATPKSYFAIIKFKLNKI